MQGSENLLADYFYIFDFVNIYICCAITETPRRSSRLTGVSGATRFALSVKLRRSPLRVSLLTDALPFAKYTMHNCYTAPYFLESVFIVVTELLQIFRSILCIITCDASSVCIFSKFQHLFCCSVPNELP